MLKKLLSLILLGLFCCPLVFAGNTSYRVAIINSRDLGPYNTAIESIEKHLKQELKAVEIRQYSLEGKIDKGAAVGKKVTADKNDLLITVGTEATQVAMEHTSDVPIVTSMVYSPQAEGLVRGDQQLRVYGAPLAVPWTNQFKLLKELLPQWQSYAIIYRPGAAQSLMAGVNTAAEQNALNLSLHEIENLADLTTSAKAAAEESDALIMVLDRQLYNRTTVKELFLFCARKRYPIITFSPNYVASGALLSLSVDYEENGKDAALLSALLLKNSSPIKEHFSAPSKVLLTWNSNVADSLSINLSKQAKDQINYII